MPEPVIPCEMETRGLCYALVCFKRIPCPARDREGWPRYADETVRQATKFTERKQVN